MTRSRIILCIDDEPIRYHRIARDLKRLADLTVVVTCRMEDVVFYTTNDSYEICGVCLDHDMPFGNGVAFAQTFFTERSIPVAIVSQNFDGARNIQKVLQEYETPCILLPMRDDDAWNRNVIDYFVRHIHIKKTLLGGL